jgi:hypothetical protein
MISEHKPHIFEIPRFFASQAALNFDAHHRSDAEDIEVHALAEKLKGSDHLHIPVKLAGRTAKSGLFDVDFDTMVLRAGIVRRTCFDEDLEHALDQARVRDDDT